MIQNTTFFSIIIPTFNQARYLPAALESLLAQTDGDWEAIIVNDGSTDETHAIAEDYALRDARIRCIHKPNGGVASALNAGLACAHGAWLHWLSSDDMFEPTKLEINRRWIERYPEIKFFFSYFTLLREPSGSREKRDLWGPLPDPRHQLLTLFYRNFISGISICVNRAAWDSVGHFDESLRYAQDYDQWLRLLQRYQGRFIPEWTVISRNHVDQGSETFPDACYYDTAKAAIRFINKHGFGELVPWLDFADKNEVRRAVSYALDVASDRSAFLYSLGAHPALILRILEWVFSQACDDEDLRSEVQRRVAENSLVKGDDDWVWMWRQLATAIHPDGRPCIYYPIDIMNLELREYRQRRLRGDLSASGLCDYLVKFECLTPNNLDRLGVCGPRVALLLETEGCLERYVPVLQRLAEQGTRIVALVLANSQPSVSWRQYAWGDLVDVAAYDKDCLPWLGEVELVVTSPGISIPLWLNGFAEIELATGETAERVERYVVDTYFKLGTKRRHVVFLERVLWGGGAERVVLDVARHLDRKMYHPVILTMFDEHLPPEELPSYISIYNKQALARAEAENSTGPKKLAIRKESFTAVRRVYHWLVPINLRNKFRLRQRLSGLRHTPLSLVASSHSPEPGNFAILSENGAIDASDDSRALDYVSAAVHHSPNVEMVLKVIGELGGDAVLVAVMEEAAVVAWLAQGGKAMPYMVSLHTFESDCMADIYRVPMRQRAERHWLSMACNHARSVTLPSDGCVEDLRRNFSVESQKIRKLWNPIDCAAVRRQSFQLDADALAWRDKANGFRLVHVGRLDPQKNHDLLLDACVELKRRGLRVSLALVGEGHDRHRIENRISELDISGEVTLVGERRNPFPWIKAADSLILTSHFEAFALVLVEAMVCGTPVVAVDCPAGPREVLGNGEYGLLVPSNDVIALADAVEKIMADPDLRQKLVACGYDRAGVFDIKRIVKEWQSLIDAIPSLRQD